MIYPIRHHADMPQDDINLVVQVTQRCMAIANVVTLYRRCKHMPQSKHVLCVYDDKLM